jgi:type I restriction enzyme S subunit
LADVAIVNPPKDQLALHPDTPTSFVPMSAVAPECGGVHLTVARPFLEVCKGYTQFRSGDVIFAKITPCMENGKVAVVPSMPKSVAYGSTEFHVIRPGRDVVGTWVAYFLGQHAVRMNAQRSMTGSAGQLRVPSGWVESLEIPVPPLPTQRAIASRLDELFTDLDAGVAALQRVRAKLKRYRASVLKAAVEGRLTADWRKEHFTTEDTESTEKTLEGEPKAPSAVEGRPREPQDTDLLMAAEPQGTYAADSATAALSDTRHPTPDTPASVSSVSSVVPCESGPALLKRILAERRRKWEADQRAKFAAAKKPPPTGWQKKYVEPAAPDTSSLPALPEGWCWATVEQCSVKVVDGVHKKPDYVAEGVPFVTIRNLTAGTGIDLDHLNHITPKDHAEFTKRADPESGDILISKDGTLGVVRVVRTTQPFSIFVSVALVKPVLRASSDYLGMALSSPQVQLQMVPKGSGLQHIHLEDLRLDAVPLAPLAEQQQIVAEVERRLSVADEVEAQIDTNLKRAARLRQAVLKRAFAGGLV